MPGPWAYVAASAGAGGVLKHRHAVLVGLEPVGGGADEVADPASAGEGAVDEVEDGAHVVGDVHLADVRGDHQALVLQVLLAAPDRARAAAAHGTQAVAPAPWWSRPGYSRPVELASRSRAKGVCPRAGGRGASLSPGGSRLEHAYREQRHEPAIHVVSLVSACSASPPW